MKITFRGVDDKADAFQAEAFYIRRIERFAVIYGSPRFFGSDAVKYRLFSLHLCNGA